MQKNKQRPVRFLMLISMLLLIIFQGYWLNKLYHDEYGNLKKEVNVVFRDAMYKLQQRRFEKDTSLTVHQTTNMPGIVAKTKNIKGMLMPVKFYNNQVNVGKTSAELKQNNIKPDNTENTNIVSAGAIVSGTLSSSVAALGRAMAKNPAGSVVKVLPAGVLEVILKRKGDSGKSTVKADTVVKTDSFLRVREGKMQYFIKYEDGQERKHAVGDSASSHPTLSPMSGFRMSPQSRDTPSLSKGGAYGFTGKNDERKVSRLKNMVAGKAMANVSVKPVVSQLSPMFGFLSNNKTINDSIPVKTIDSAYKAELSKSFKQLPYRIAFKTYLNYEQRNADLKEDSTREVVTNKIPVGFNTPYTYQARFGDVRYFVLKKIKLQLAGSILLLLLVGVSFMLMYRNLMAQQRLATIKNDFISNITHELKTPIATVNVAIEALRNFNAIQNPELTKEYLDISASELQRLSLLVDKVLKLSMFESKRIELKKEIFDLKELVQETLNIMKLQFDKHKAVVSFTVIPGDFTIDADKLHITSVIYNLLDNALKYRKDGPAIDVYLSAAHEGILELSVVDNGIGIPPQYQHKIFDKFFRVPTGDKHNTKGYGLGLSYVAEIIKSHGGSIDVESELGKGSKFIVKLPAHGMTA